MDVTKNLKWSLQALACSAKEQLLLFPDYTEVADELALAWEEVYEEQLNLDELEEPFKIALVSLDEYLLSISGKKNASLWTVEAMNNNAEWAKIRKLAQHALAVAGWEKITPEVNPDFIYVHQDSD